MKRIALALIACAGLGFVAGRQPVLPTDSRSSEPGPAVAPQVTVTEEQPVETPLVEKLLVKEPQVVPYSPVKSPGPVDGDRTADGFFEFDDARRAWIPVDYGHPHYDHNDAPVGIEHLIAVHGHARSSAKHWTRDEIEVAHANSHFWERTHGAPQRQSAPVYTQSTGDCPNCVKPSRGIFGRWR